MSGYPVATAPGSDTGWLPVALIDSLSLSSREHVPNADCRAHGRFAPQPRLGRNKQSISNEDFDAGSGARRPGCKCGVKNARDVGAEIKIRKARLVMNYSGSTYHVRNESSCGVSKIKCHVRLKEVVLI